MLVALVLINWLVYALVGGLAEAEDSCVAIVNRGRSPSLLEFIINSSRWYWVVLWLCLECMYCCSYPALLEKSLNLV